MERKHARALGFFFYIEATLHACVFVIVFSFVRSRVRGTKKKRKIEKYTHFRYTIAVHVYLAD